ncbi:MAG: hypothetical protein V8S24_07240 [Gordonibacter pamelaeae]
MTLHRYDAASTVPLSWTSEGCTEAAFCAAIMHGAAIHPMDGLHARRGGPLRHPHGALQGRMGSSGSWTASPPRSAPASMAPVRARDPEIDNTYRDCGPFGVSVFDGALGALKLADGSFDNTWRDVFLGQKLLFLPRRCSRPRPTAPS